MKSYLIKIGGMAERAAGANPKMLIDAAVKVDR
jgi:hypothetical protein